MRDSITQLADIHCVSTERAKYRVYGLTGDWSCIWNTGCPSIDLAKQALSEPPVTWNEMGGAGVEFEEYPTPIVAWLQHPVTNEMAEAGAQMEATAAALRDAPYDVVAFWPGEDAGADAMSKTLRLSQDWCHTIRNLPPSRFLRFLTQCACLVGNSSAGIREASYLGVPVVNIGTRQQGRERGPNVIGAPHDTLSIRASIEHQIAHGPYQSSTLYGLGNAGERIAEVIDGCARGFVPTGDVRRADRASLV